MTVPAWLRRLAGHCLVLLVALLPALLAGSRIDAPPAPGEWERLAHAVEDPADSAVVRGFLTAQVPADVSAVPPAGTPAAARLLARARLIQVLGLFALSLLTYLALTLASGRARGLLCCAFLCVLPPLTAAGHVLRPETPAALFGLLALVLLLGVATLQQPALARRASAATLAAAGLCAGVALGLAAGSLPGAGILLLLPGLCATVIMVQLAVRLLRALRRRLWVVVPVRAATGRLWPWAFAAVAALAATLLVLELAVPAPGALAPSAATVDLLPSAPWARWPLAVLAALGAFRLIVRAGLRLGRRGRPDGDFLLMLYCAILLAQRWLGDGAADALPAAVPMAVLLADGAVHAVLLAAARRRR